jgi:hypothetical protein
MREHDETQNARRDMGARGITLTGHAYAYCARCAGYHYVNANAQTRIPTRGRVRLTWPKRVSQRNARADVFVGTLTQSHNSRVRALA